MNHPAHYAQHPSGVEVIEMTEHLSFNLGNAVKYVTRHERKGKPEEDLKKALWYTQRATDRRERAHVTKDVLTRVHRYSSCEANYFVVRFLDAIFNGDTEDAENILWEMLAAPAEIQKAQEALK